MSLRNMTLPLIGTISVAGGTPTAFADDGNTVQNGLHLIVPNDTNYLTRRSITAKVRQATMQPDGTMSKIKRGLTFVKPTVLASGQVAYNVVRCEIDVHPEVESTIRAELLSMGALLFSDNDTADFWSVGSLV